MGWFYTSASHLCLHRHVMGVTLTLFTTSKFQVDFLLLFHKLRQIYNLKIQLVKTFTSINN
jgi:hypothetical protein